MSDLLAAFQLGAKLGVRSVTEPDWSRIAADLERLMAGALVLSESADERLRDADLAGVLAQVLTRIRKCEIPSIP